MKTEITKTNKNFDAFKFVIAAISKESSRYAITYLYIEKDCIVATDGRRLHKAIFEHEYPLGFYEVLKNTKTQIDLLKIEEEGGLVYCLKNEKI